MIKSIVTIDDNFDLDKIVNSGQCFRAKLLDDGYYRFILGANILYIRPISENNNKHINQYETLSNTPWNPTWHRYFDLKRNYHSLATQIKRCDKFMRRAEEYSRGIRILRQDPWETLVSFVISQRKSIPAIKSCVEKLCDKYGDTLEDTYDDTCKDACMGKLEDIKLFPRAKQLAGCDICDCGLGYREDYIRDLALNPPDLKAYEKLDTSSLLEALMEIKGVGCKVANCVALFAYGRMECAPVDTWIKKIIDHYYEGFNPLPGYGSVAGIMQQYAFYYIQNNKSM